MPRWNLCNVLQAASDTNRLWQFEVKSSGPVLSRELTGASFPTKFASKSWTSLWQPKLNVAWLPPENVFLRVIELPQSNFEETLAMVELQLEKLSPMPVAQIVWTIHILPTGAGENLQTVVVVIVEHSAVEKFLGQLESRGFLPDRLEVPMLDELQPPPATENGAWIYPGIFGGRSAALVVWWFGGVLRNLSFVVLPTEGERAKNLKSQLAQLVWAGELEGWLTTSPEWHLVAEGSLADEWQILLRESLDVPVQLVKPLSPAELATNTARRVTQPKMPAGAALLPAEFSTRFHQQFVDRLWLHGLVAVGILYAVGVMIYFGATNILGYQTTKVERQVAALSGSYTNALQLKARYDILRQRQDLKFAALDCLKIVAEQLPSDVSLQRFSFADGRQLSLSGVAPSDDIDKLFDFNSGMQKAKIDNQPMFSSTGGDPLVYHTLANNTVSWSFSLKLSHAEEEQP